MFRTISGMIATNRRSLAEPPANGDPVSENPEINHCVKSHWQQVGPFERARLPCANFDDLRGDFARYARSCLN
jgi:hypothetical protein